MKGEEVFMNIKDILTYGGYEVIEENIITNARASWTHKYKIRYTQTRIDDMLHDLEKEGGTYGYDICSSWTVVVTGVGFDGLGNLWISIAREHDLTECWDLIEFGKEVSENE